MMRKILIVIVAVVIAIAGLAAVFLMKGPAETVSSSPVEQAIKDRQSKFKTMGSIMKTLDEQIKSDDPDQKKITDGVNRLVALGAAIPDWFPAGTGPESGFKTNAKPEIWTDSAQFGKLHEDFMAEVKKLSSVATKDRLGELTSQYYTTGVACANCHKPFRMKMD